MPRPKGVKRPDLRKAPAVRPTPVGKEIYERFVRNVVGSGGTIREAMEALMQDYLGDTIRETISSLTQEYIDDSEEFAKLGRIEETHHE